MRYPDGEYWIHDGSVTYCDGDIGRDNHEAVVIDHVQRDIIEKVGDIRRKYGGWFGDDGEGVDWDGWKGLKERELLVAKYGEDGADEKEDEGEPLLVAAAHAAGVTDEAWETAEMQNDAREYGMEHLGWKAVRGTSVDTWTLTPEDMGDIASGLDEILNGEGGYDEDDGDYDEDEGTAQGEEIEWSIVVHSTNRTYEMTISQLEEGAKGQGPRASAATSARDIEWQQSSAAKSARQADIDRLHPYYQNRTFPIGDSAFGVPTFREWLRGRQTRE